MDLSIDHTYSDGALRCPWCNFEYVHIVTVDVGARQDGEDTPLHLLRIDATKASIAVREPLVDLSTRRQWVSLVIDCEQCDGGVLSLVQRKGQTIVKFAPEQPRGE